MINNKTDIPPTMTEEPNGDELLQMIFPKLEIVLETLKSKFESSTPNLFLKSSTYTPTFKTITSFTLQSENPTITTDKYSSITDCLNYVSTKSIDPNLLLSLLNCLSPKGTLFLLLNLESIKRIYSSLKEALPKDYATNLFIKFYILDKIPFYGLLSIQVMGEAKNPIDLETIKLIFYEVYEDNSLSKPLSLQLNIIAKLSTNMSKLYRKVKELSKLSPKRIAHVSINENYCSDNIEFSLIVIDYEIDQQQESNQEKGMNVIVVNKAYIADILFLSFAGLIQMCRQTNAARVLLVRSSPFNYDTTQRLREKIYSYIMLFAFDGCAKENITIRLMNDDKNEQYRVLSNPQYTIRDLVINDNKETFRQLFALRYNEEVLYQERLILTSKAKAKQDSSYIQLHTIEKFAQKNLVSCFDDTKILSYYVNSVLCSILFLDIEFYPATPFHILIIGGGLGMVSHYCNKFLKEKVEITIVEPNKELITIGKDYFGMNNYDSKEKSKINWKYDELHQYIQNILEKDYYDMVIVDYWRGDGIEGTIPPKSLFTLESLKQISQSMKPTGVFMFNLLCRSYIHLCEAFEHLEKTFPLMYSLHNNEPLDKIFFCFKTFTSIEVHKSNYKKNIAKLSNKEIADMSLILEEHERVLSRVENMEDLRNIIQSQIY